MLGVHKLNPMARAIGTMGAIVAVVGGVTFATLSSNTVALTNNQLTAGTATLKISLDNSNFGNNKAGMSGTGYNNLQPGVTSPNYLFYIKNTGNIPLNLTVGIDQTAFVGDTGVQPGDVTLNISCDDGGSSSGTLNQYTGGTPLGTVNAGAVTTCNANVTLSSSYNGASGASVPSFDISFVGNAQ